MSKLETSRDMKLIMLILVLFAGIFFHAPKISAAPISDISEYPRTNTSDVSKPSGSTYAGSVGATNIVSHFGTNPFYLWCQDRTYAIKVEDGTCYSSQSIASERATRTEGGSGASAVFEVVVPAQEINNGIKVTLLDICKPISDNNGWEDHMYNSPSISASTGAGAGIGVTVKAGNSTYSSAAAYCNGSASSVTVDLTGYFTKDTDAGSIMYSALVSVDDNSTNDSEKLFGAQVNYSTVYIGPAPKTGYVNIGNPSADYFYHAVGPCNNGANGNNCPDPTGANQGGYTSANQRRDSEDVQSNVYASNGTPVSAGAYSTAGAINSYDFYFSPDCNANSSNNQLIWRAGAGSSQTQDPSTIGWTLYDNGSVMDSADYNILANSNSASERWQPNHMYRWHWYGVDRAHAVSIRLPFSEYTATSGFSLNNCPRPSGAIQNISASCDSMTLYGFDVPQNSLVPVNFAIYHRDNTYSGGSLVSYNDGQTIANYPNYGPDYQGTINTSTWGGNSLTVSGLSGLLKPIFASHQGEVIFYLRIQDPVDGRWYWVNPGQNPTYQNSPNPPGNPSIPDPGPPGEPQPPYSAGTVMNTSWGFPFYRTCVAPVAYPPQGYINGSSCVNYALTGWASDQDSPGTSINVQVLFRRTGTTSWTPYVWNSPYGNNVYQTDSSHNFAIPAWPGLLDGNRYEFIVIPLGVDTSGTPDTVNGSNATGLDSSGPPPQHNPSNTPPYAIAYAGLGLAAGATPYLPAVSNVYGNFGETMLACTTFDTNNSNTGVNLSPNLEDPTLYNAVSNLYLTYGTVNSPFNGVTIPMGCSVQVTKNGAPINSLNCGASYGPTNSTGPHVINGPSGPITSWQAGDQYCSILTPQYLNGIVQENGQVLTSTPGSPISSSCGTVKNESYVHFFGSDVFAGGGFGDYGSCTTANAGINTYVSNTGFSGGGTTQPVGSGVQIGALAIGNINGFASASLRGSAPQGSTGLSFSNTTNLSYGANPPGLGGGFKGTHCVTDYFSRSSKATAWNTASSVSNVSIANGSGSTVNSVQYFAPAGGTLTISGPSALDSMSNETIYVKGNVVINGSISYNSDTSSGCTSVGANDPCWGRIENVPSLYIITEGGNIYVNSGVHQLDGIYVSQPDTSNNGGSIYTCASGATALLPGPGGDPNILNDCKTQLLVNGAFVAQKTYLSRTFGSLRDGYPGEYLNYTARSCSDSVSTNLGDCAAEVFNFSPEMYLSQPAITPSSGPTSGKYDYITSLSPVF